MKDLKIKCDCKCGNILWIIDVEDKQLEITTMFKKRKSMTGVMIDKSKLKKLLEF